MTRGALRGAALIGTATGLRSQLGLAAVLTSRRGRTYGGTGTYHRRWPGVLAAGAAAGELVADKRQKMPSRLDTAGLVPRLLLGGVSAGILAHRHGAWTVMPVLVGAAGAMGGAVLGAAWRDAFRRIDASDRYAALIEDAVALLMAVLACRVPARR